MKLREGRCLLWIVVGLRCYNGARRSSCDFDIVEHTLFRKWGLYTYARSMACQQAGVTVLTPINAKPVGDILAKASWGGIRLRRRARRWGGTRRSDLFVEHLNISLTNVDRSVCDVDQSGNTIEIDIRGVGRPVFVIGILDAGIIAKLDYGERRDLVIAVAVVERDNLVVVDVLDIRSSVEGTTWAKSASASVMHQRTVTHHSRNIG